MKNLNEEIERIKSLFGNNRIYGNLINGNKELINEQGVGKKLAKILSGSDEISKNLTKVLRDIDPIRATKFATTEFKTFDDLLDHLNDYDDIWRKILKPKDFDYLNDILNDFSRLSAKGTLKDVIKKNNITKGDFMSSIPQEGGMFEIIYDLWDDVIEGKSVKSSEETVVFTKKGNEVIVHKVDSNGDVVSTQKIDNQGNKIEDKTYSKEDAKTEVEDYFSGKSGGSSSGTKEIEIDPKSKDDVIKGEILNGVDEAVDNVKGKKNITTEELEKRIEDGDILMYVDSETKQKRYVNKYEIYEFIYDESTDTWEKKVIQSKNTEGSGSSGGSSGGNNKSNFFDTLKTGGNAAAQFFRWTMPTVSEGVRLAFGWVPFVRNQYGGWIQGSRFAAGSNRFTLVPLKDIEGGFAEFKRRGGQVVEVLPRLIIEQVFLITLNEVYKTYERGGLPSEEGVVSTALADYPQSYFYKYHPLTIISQSLVSLYGDLTNSKEIAYTVCRKKLEKIMPPEQVTNSKELKECKDKVDKFFNSVEEMKKSLENIKGKYNYDSWDDQKKKDFCEDKDNKKTELYKDLDLLIEKSRNIEKTMDETIPNDATKGAGFVRKIISALNFFLPSDLPNVPEIDGIKSKIIPKLESEGEILSPTKLEKIKSDLETKCVDYLNNLDNQNIPDYVEPSSVSDSTDNPNQNNNQNNDQNKIQIIGKINIEIKAESIELVS
jgi:hypothetical protein